MKITAKAKIAKNGKYLTHTDDIRLECDSDGMWGLVGFAHNPDGVDCKHALMRQSGDHYGIRDGSIIGCTLIDTPQFFGVKKYTYPEIRDIFKEGVPLQSKWGFPAAHFGQHCPITFRFAGKDGLGDCVLYDIVITGFAW